MTPIEAIHAGWGALSLGTAYIGRRPADASGAYAVLAPYGGTTAPTLPTTAMLVQVCHYSTSQATATANAQASYDALHQKINWALTDWTVEATDAMQPPFPLPPVEGQGGTLYRVAYNIRLMMRPAT